MKILIAMVSFFTISLFSQNTSDEKDLYLFFDQTVGIKNTNLSYGKIYAEQYRSLEKNHQYFKDKAFTLGDVVYQNQPYYKVLIKYNISQDELIINLSSTFENRAIVLEKSLIDKFTISKTPFIVIETLGFCEVIHESETISFYKKHLKTKNKKLDNSFIYYNFLDKNEYYLKYNNKLTEISKSKDVYTVFPNKKKAIKTFYKDNRKLLKTDANDFYKKLATFLIQEKNNNL